MEEYISKKDTIKAMDKIIYEASTAQEANIMFKIKSVICNQNVIKLPMNIQPVEHGQWESSEELWEKQMTRCSNCKAEMYVEDLYNVSGGTDMLPVFCPQCGCYMRGNTE